MRPSSFGLSQCQVRSASSSQCPGERPWREQAFLDEVKVHINGAGKGCPGRRLSRKNTWKRVMRGNNSPGKAGREGYTTTAQQLQRLSPGAGAVVRAITGVTAAAEPPASAMGHEGGQMYTCYASGKTVFPCRNHLSQILISAQGSPSQSKKLSL